MNEIWVPLVAGLISFIVFYPLGCLTGKWLRQVLKPSCSHEWEVLVEKYPTFIEDRWTCTKCGVCENFFHSEPPVRIAREMCDMGHVHIVPVPEWEEWPNVVE